MNFLRELFYRGGVYRRPLEQLEDERDEFKTNLKGRWVKINNSKL